MNLSPDLINYKTKIYPTEKNFNWTENFAYCIGIITADGNLSKDRRHIHITSKDLNIIENCRKTLSINTKIKRKSREKEKIKKYFILQFSNVNLYKFLLDIGITPAKSLTIKKISIPCFYFKDFLRGYFDGDGSISIYHHNQSSVCQVKLRFSSASYPFLEWVKDKISKHCEITGGFITKSNRCFSLDYGKRDAGKIIKFMYYDGVQMYLDRKHILAGRVEKLVYS